MLSNYIRPDSFCKDLPSSFIKTLPDESVGKVISCADNLQRGEELSGISQPIIKKYFANIKNIFYFTRL
jgi:hypothetical protein